jgi:putative DNA primase/helicase
LTLDALLERLEGVRSIPTGFVARCPGHDDRQASLSLSEAPDRILMFCHAGCQTADVMSALDLSLRDLYLDGATPEGGYVPYTRQEPEAQFIYEDEYGHEIYRVLRYPGKQFVHVFRRVPYGLPQVLRAVEAGESVYIVEGEKDALALAVAQKTATCNSGGAGKWLPEFARYFQGARVIIVRDKDEINPKTGLRPGHEHARDVAACLFQVAESIHVVEAREGKDASDHLAAGLRPEDFVVVQGVK